MASYKISSVTIEVRPGVLLTAEVSSPAELRQLLADLDEEGFSNTTPTSKSRKAAPTLPEPPVEPEGPEVESPIGRVATRMDLPAGTLTSARVLAFKDGAPQLLRPTTFASVSDATLVLVYAVEIGLKKPSISYDDFRDLYEAQNIKSGSALPTLLTNLRNAGYMDKKTYATDRTVRLTAKGAARAEEVIKGLCGAKS